jgi:hypothetical protein
VDIWRPSKRESERSRHDAKLDPSKKPKAADWKITTEGDLNGKTALGIYDVDENTFKHCFALEKRPEKFESEEGSKVTNAVLKRVKKWRTAAGSGGSDLPMVLFINLGLVK